MHADKIDAQKKQSFFLYIYIKPQVLTWASCFFLKFTEGHLIMYYQMMYLKSEIKIDTMNYRKNNFNLTTSQFMFSKYKPIKKLHILNDVCWVFDQRSSIFKNTFKNWHLFDFISIIKLE
jgi:hypothetical protein